MIVRALEDLSPIPRNDRRRCPRPGLLPVLESLSLPAIWWQGTFDLLLHADCANRLALKLLADRRSPKGGDHAN